MPDKKLSKRKSKAGASTKRAKSPKNPIPHKSRRVIVSDDDGSEPSTDADNEDTDDGRKKRPKLFSITDRLKGNKRPRTRDLVESYPNKRLGLDGFKNRARWLATCHSPSIPWLNVLAAGLERDGVIEEESMGKVTGDEKQRDELLHIYDLLRDDLPDFQEDIEAVIEDGSIGCLMNESGGDAISQDIRKMKDAILPWLSDVLGRGLDPPIEPNVDKYKTRRFNHPDLARLLCTPIKLPIFDKDPDAFCQQARENDLDDGPITAGHFPAMFYSDLGQQASEGVEFVFENLLYGWLVILTWVFLFLGESNAAQFRINMPGLRDNISDTQKFKVKKCGKAYRNGLTSVTYRTMAYATFILRHTMSASDDRRIEEGGVIKQDAFDAVVALFEDEQFMDEEWIEQLMRDWQAQIDWMLPSEKKPQLMDEDDKDSSLNQVAQAVKMKKERRAAKAAAKASSTVSASDPPSTSSSDTSAPVSGSTPASADQSALASASDPTSTPLANSSAPAVELEKH
ncbi:hypothetical protein K435DRAFT_867169 [Dendrothele bispora CBS 962.96]|uniref:Uncharacterized protein n=1 Tax=Dendrothele bispora (strain CBS 962.96) TaxID=1314807 RepID=A0A4S8LFK0_DENBC|nr:hypothetical protein K435DRAFT_867169 [Dendrothele bispora CBS 962.96]